MPTTSPRVPMIRTLHPDPAAVVALLVAAGGDTRWTVRGDDRDVPMAVVRVGALVIEVVAGTPTGAVEITVEVPDMRAAVDRIIAGLDRLAGADIVIAIPTDETGCAEVRLGTLRIVIGQHGRWGGAPEATWDAAAGENSAGGLM